jgi:hypothetical protein
MLAILTFTPAKIKLFFLENWNIRKLHERNTLGQWMVPSAHRANASTESQNRPLLLRAKAKSPTISASASSPCRSQNPPFLPPFESGGATSGSGRASLCGQYLASIAIMVKTELSGQRGYQDSVLEVAFRGSRQPVKRVVRRLHQRHPN